jgi:hypothetical protein
MKLVLNKSQNHDDILIAVGRWGDTLGIRSVVLLRKTLSESYGMPSDYRASKFFEEYFFWKLGFSTVTLKYEDGKIVVDKAE